MSHIDSKSPREANIFPTSFLFGMLVMRDRRAGSMLASSKPANEATITNHHTEGPVMQANTIDQRPMETNPNTATV